MKRSYLFIIPFLFYSSVSYSQGKFSEIDRSIDKKLKDTTHFNPWMQSDQVNFKINLSKGSHVSEQKAQIEFLYSSGFPFALKPSGKPANKLPSTFKETDEQYKLFLKAHAENEYIDVFRQNASVLIIRKFLLKNLSKNNELEFYTKELLETHSTNYAILYLALQQLKSSLNVAKLKGYKEMIHSDTVVINYNKRLQQMERFINSEPNNYDEKKGYNIVAKAILLNKERNSFFIKKIDDL